MKYFSIFIATIFSLVSCSFERASFELSDGAAVEVDRKSMNDLEVGQKVWLIRSYPPAIRTDWEILDPATIGEIGFEPNTDTIFVFESKRGAYKRRVSLAVLVKKY